jgi:hypothetical protein
MPLSLSSYLLGVGTVVGAVACGFGGGVFLTNTVMKDTAAPPTRVERVARSEPAFAASPAPTANAQAVTTKENPAPAEPAPAAQPDPGPAAQVPAVQVPVAQVPAARAEPPKPDARKQSAQGETESPKQPEPTKQAEPTRPTDQSGTEQKKAAERKADRNKRYAERKARETAAGKVRQQQLEVQDQPDPPELAYSREEPHFDLFRILNPLSLDPWRDRGE